MANQNYFVTDFEELESPNTVIGRYPPREGGFNADSIINKPAGFGLVIIQEDTIKGFSNEPNEVDFYLGKDCKIPLKSGLFSSKYKNTEVFLPRYHTEQKINLGEGYPCKAKVLNGKMLNVQFRNLCVSLSYDIVPDMFLTAYAYIRDTLERPHDDPLCMSVFDVEDVVKKTILDFFQERLVDKFRPALQKDGNGIFITSSDVAWNVVRMGSLENAMSLSVFAKLKEMGLDPKGLKFVK